MAATAEKVKADVNSTTTNPETANPVTAGSTGSDVTGAKATGSVSAEVTVLPTASAAVPANDSKNDAKSTSDKPTKPSTEEAVLNNLKQKLLEVVMKASEANRYGRSAVENLFIAKEFGSFSVPFCGDSVRLLDEVLKSFGKEKPLPYWELERVQKDAKICYGQAQEALKAIDGVSEAARVALLEGDKALADLIQVYSSWQTEKTLTASYAQTNVPSKNNSLESKKVGEAQTLSDSLKSLDSLSLHQKLSPVIAAATKSNQDGRFAVVNLESAQAIGIKSVIACNQAVDWTDDILKDLNKNSQDYKNLLKVQEEARYCQVKSNAAIDIINKLVIQANAALALGNGTLVSLLTVDTSLNAHLKSKAMTFSAAGNTAASGGAGPKADAAADAAKADAAKPASGISSVLSSAGCKIA